MRDLTRGGLAAALVQFARTTGLCLTVDEAVLPIRETVRGACDLLGLDALTVANEGTIVLVCPATEADRVVATLKSDARMVDACIVGEVSAEPAGRALLKQHRGAEGHPDADGRGSAPHLLGASERVEGAAARGLQPRRICRVCNTPTGSVCCRRLRRHSARMEVSWREEESG